MEYFQTTDATKQMQHWRENRLIGHGSYEGYV